MTTTIHGPFDIKRTPLTNNDLTELGNFAGFSLDKHFHGELSAHGRGIMIAAGTEVKGSAGYIALERVSGTLAGKTGSFVLQHSGLMDRGTPQLQIHVVPDSASGELLGLRGTMTIEILDGGQHFYRFSYEIVNG